MTSQAFDREAVRWSLKGQRLGAIGPHAEGIISVSVAGDGRIVTSASDRYVRIFDAGGQLQLTIGPWVDALQAVRVVDRQLFGVTRGGGLVSLNLAQPLARTGAQP